MVHPLAAPILRTVMEFERLVTEIARPNLFVFYLIFSKSGPQQVSYHSSRL